jgi:hypothetical protein
VTSGSTKPTCPPMLSCAVAAGTTPARNITRTTAATPSTLLEAVFLFCNLSIVNVLLLCFILPTTCNTPKTRIDRPTGLARRLASQPVPRGANGRLSAEPSSHIAGHASPQITFETRTAPEELGPANRNQSGL